MSLQTELYRCLRKIIGSRQEENRSLAVQFQGQPANDLVREKLLESAPCLIGRFGSNELDATLRAFERQQPRRPLHRIVRYVRGEGEKFWWDRSIRKRMARNAGFFPTTDEHLQRFGEMMLRDCAELDVLGSWRRDEWRIRHLFEQAVTIDLIDLEPFRHRRPWSSALQGKTVLVVHPFEQSIRAQYPKRSLLFRDPEVLPEFELLTLKSIQSSGNNPVPFADWFAALDYMCDQINQLDFEIAIVGAGAYGLPLAAHVKRMGRKAVHLGGATQLLFGILGHRWDNEAYQYVINEHWCRPLDEERPPRADLIEQNAYW